MGNYFSCFYVHRLGLKTAKLVNSKGILRHVKVPVKAAELMLEEPGYVVSAVHELLRNGRVTALRAEDELLAGNLYLFVSITRVNHKASWSEMRLIESAIAIDKISRKNKRGSKVLPDVSVEEQQDQIESHEAAEVHEEKQNAGFAVCPHLGNHRLWTPVLEPIFEEP